jgi:acyl-ACP thioesterase
MALVETAADPDEFVALPASGRRVTRERRVGLSDAAASGRLRLDALARFLQDVASDDVNDAGLVGNWVLRRVALAIGDVPRIGELVSLTTFCSGYGSRWAERRTTVTAVDRVAAEVVSIWVYVDDLGRPAPLRDWFFDLYAEAAAGRRVSPRLHHAPPPVTGAETRVWPLRVTDLDVLAHVNNAASWAAVEDELGRREPGRRVTRAEMEYRAPVDLDDAVELRTLAGPDALACWLTCGDEVRTSALVHFG